MGRNSFGRSKSHAIDATATTSSTRERHDQIQAGNGDAEHRLSDFGQKQLN
jgi:hypothetical protein